jgi:AP-1 complex subunit beta-1
MQTDDLEQKKLVYLYLMNYAKTQPELVILAVNTFVKDSDDPNPLVRALAIRTMGCLRAERIIDYLCDPLQKCLRDENPYVRKTAALCVAKLYDLKPELVIDNGFLDQLQEMISDSNPMASFAFMRVVKLSSCLIRLSPIPWQPSQTSTLLRHHNPAPRPPTQLLLPSLLLFSTSCSSR